MKSLWKKLIGGLLLGVLCTSGWLGAQQTPSKPAGSSEQQQRQAVMKSKGTDASLTILPARLSGKPFDRLTEVIGMLLEQQGLKNIELGKTVFDPAAASDLPGLAAAVDEFVKAHPVTTEYVLYVEMNGTRETGLNELRAVVADKTGAVVSTDLQSPQDRESRDPHVPVCSSGATAESAVGPHGGNRQGRQTGQDGSPHGRTERIAPGERKNPPA